MRQTDPGSGLYANNGGNPNAKPILRT